MKRRDKVNIIGAISFLFLSSLREEINEFAENLLNWLDDSLSEVPPALKEAKCKGQFMI